MALLTCFLLLFPAPTVAAPLPECVLDFESGCPSASSVCGATFTGGQGCAATGDPPGACGAEAGQAYRLIGTFEDGEVHNDAATIDFAGDVGALRLLFYSSSSAGFMSFFDEGGVQVGATLQSRHCRGGGEPVSTQLVFERPVRRIEVTTTGATANVWIDDLHVNPSDIVPTQVLSWSALKARH